MKKLILIMLNLKLLVAFAEEPLRIDFETQYLEAKKLIDYNCFKCNNGSSKKIQYAINNLEKIKSVGTNNKFFPPAMELLGDAYLDMYNYSNNDKTFEQKIYNNYKLAYDSINNSWVNTKLTFKLLTSINDKKKRLKLLKPILGLQADFSQAKYYEGKILIEQGSIDAGLEALEMSVATALYVNAFYNGDDIAAILKKHGRNEMAKKILEKKK